jgi:osmotically-inducible protein OsmY
MMISVRSRSRRPPAAALLLAALAVSAVPGSIPRAAEPPAAPKRNVAGPADYGLRERIRQALSKDTDLAQEKFNLVVVNGGAVFSGRMKSLALKTRVLRTAATTRGVINVTDQMTVERGEVSDEALQNAILANLRGAAEPLGLKDLKINVVDGVATLSGSVRDFASRVRAEDVAASVQGVIQVTNQLQPANTPSGNDDPSLLQAVVDYLGNIHELAQAIDLQVKVKDGVVTLTGRAAVYLARQQAGVMTSLVKGVRGVDNHIKVDLEMIGQRPSVQAAR